jgi:hypothetical protein
MCDQPILPRKISVVERNRAVTLMQQNEPPKGFDFEALKEYKPTTKKDDE